MGTQPPIGAIQQQPVPCQPINNAEMPNPFRLHAEPVPISEQPRFVGTLRHTQMKAEKIPRCPSCKAYMNLHNRFVVNGNNFVCSICGKESPISLEYFCKLENGVRMDRDARPELCEGTYTAVYSEQYQLTLM